MAFREIECVEGMRITDGFQWAALKVPEKVWPKSTGHLVAPCAWPFLRCTQNPEMGLTLKIGIPL